MKIQPIILIAIAATTLAVTGCNKQSPTSSGGTSAAAASVDTSKLEAAFQAAEPAAKNAVDSAVTAIKNADYSGAVTQLQALASKFKLTADQQAAVNDVIASVQKAIAGAAAKTTSDASKAVGDMTKGLPK
jgi:hypothetical protein